MEMDLVLKAQEHIRAHEAEIVRRESEIARLRDFIATANALIDQSTFPHSPSIAPAAAVPPDTSRVSISRYSTQTSTTGEILKEAQSILQERQAPMLAAEIYEILVRRGVKIGGKSPKGNLTAKFSTQRDIFHFNRPDGNWSLVEWNIKNETLPDHSGSVSEFTGEPDRSPIETQSRTDVFG
jgi:hypothetical protein